MNRGGTAVSEFRSISSCACLLSLSCGRRAGRWGQQHLCVVFLLTLLFSAKLELSFFPFFFSFSLGFVG